MRGPRPLLPIVLALLCVELAGCHRGAGIPQPGSPHYSDLVSSFYVGLAALEAGEDTRAKEGLTRASQIAPGEPASWANLAILELRQQQYDQALQHAQTAHQLAPDNSQIEALLALIQSRQGNLTGAIEQWKAAIASDPKNVKAIYALAGETERQGGPGSAEGAQKLLREILKTQGNNVPVMLEDLRLSAKLGDGVEANRMIGMLRQLSPRWPEPARLRLDSLATAAATNVRAAAVQVQFLRNLLIRDVSFRQDLDAIRPAGGIIGEPFLRFLKTTPPSSLPAASDLALTFHPKEGPTPYGGKQVLWAGAFFLDAKAEPQVIWADSQGLHLDQGSTLPLPGKQVSLMGDNSIVSGDLNYDFKSDIVMATAGGLRIYQQSLAPLFTDVTRKAKLDDRIVNGSYHGAWLFDIDLDGDLDIVLGSSDGSPVVLRNNGDGTYAAIRPFAGLNGLVAFAAADIDGDGDPDVAAIDGTGKLTIFSNERLGNFRLQKSPLIGVVAVTAAEINDDGLLDFVALLSSGRIMRVSGRQSSSELEVATLLETGAAGQAQSLHAVDIDNNGSLDLVTGGHIFLHDGKGFQPLPKDLGGECRALLDRNGVLDAVVLTQSSNLAELLARGTKPYKWQTIRVRASSTTGDQRINSYAIGGEVEVRSGLLTQKQSITSPLLHFGLGSNPEVSLARIIWPNGQLQVEFDLKPDAAALAQQRLKGSCPFLFAWDGKRMRFVKDCAPWSPALGLHINAQQVAGIGQTQEWFKIPGSLVQPHDGAYDLRITAEYWETFYIDHYSFLAVDHPPGTDVYTDERFAVPAPPLKLYGTRTAQPFASAYDDSGADVGAVLAKADGEYLDTFGRGQYQGVTRDHWVEVTLPSAAAVDGPLYLIGTGWLHPTDATVNVAMGQSSRPVPTGLSIEVSTSDGKWHAVRTGLGFPAGRMKSVVLDLTGLFSSPANRRLRLRTNLEIYWDQLAWATGIPNSELRVQRLGLTGATLTYRGFSQISQANASSPEIPNYDVIEKRGPRWRDLEGYYTRYGDVRPLLEKVDDRFLIANAGDELRLVVPAPAAPPPDGWVRDLVMVGDGWIKDGDYNSVFSKTVLPLPYHGLKEYVKNSPSLEQDPAYRLHPEDWNTYHTRYISPEIFTRALWH